MLRPCLVLLSLAAPANAQLNLGAAFTNALKNATVSEIPAYFQCNKNLIATANATGAKQPSRDARFTSHAWMH